MCDLTTPAYILKDDTLDESISSLLDSLKANFHKSIFSYSLKTNSLPYILKKVYEFGGYAEVVSNDEYELARLIGFPINKIIYNGPLKDKRTFLEAILGGAIVNIDTYREVEWLNLLPKNKIYNIGIRVNIDLKEISPSDSKDDEDYSRFGFSYENGDLAKVLNAIREIDNIEVNALHAHRTTLTRSISCYKSICDFIGGIAAEFKLELEYIDIGGGYYGIMDQKPSFNNYFSEISESLSKYFDLTNTIVIVEPGNAVVASCLDFVVSVIDIKKNRDFYIITTDGSRNDVDPFFKKCNYFYELKYSNEILKPVGLQKICGGTCLEYDKLFSLENKPLLSVEDKIIFKAVGAYTMALSPLFIRFFPNVYLLQKNNYILIRDRWSAKDFFKIYDTKNV